jgi:hypothetical protein
MASFHGEEDEKYDEIFTQIAGQIGSVQGLLDKFFGFMHRKTDFYIQFEKSSSDATMGFPEGVAETMVLQSFKKHKMKRYNSEKKMLFGTYLVMTNRIAKFFLWTIAISHQRMTLQQSQVMNLS